VIVEGYTDVIACHQAGANNVVATLGTALTHEHVSHLRRYAEQVVLLFDPDEAGQKAADRAVEIFLTGDVDVAIAMLPQGLDPADLLASAGGFERWRATIDAAQDALRYQFARIAQQLEAAETTTGRQRVAEQYVARLAQLGLGRATPAIRRSFVVQQLSELLRMPEPQVNELLSNAASRQSKARPAAQPAGDASGDGHASADAATGEDDASLPSRDKALRLAERQLLGGLVRDNELFHASLSDGTTIDEALASGDLSCDAHCRLYEQLYQTLSEGKTLTLADWLGELASQQAHELIRIVTQADQDIDAATGHQPDRLGEVVRLAAEAVREHHQRQDYEQRKRAIMGGARAAIDPEREPAQAQRLRDLVAHNRDHPSPVRIARMQQ